MALSGTTRSTAAAAIPFKMFQHPVVTVATAGTRVRVSAVDIFVKAAYFQAGEGNTADVYLCDNQVSSTLKGVTLAPRGTFSYAGDNIDGTGGEINLADFWVDADTNSNTLHVSYIKAR